MRTAMLDDWVVYGFVLKSEYALNTYLLELSTGMLKFTQRSDIKYDLSFKTKGFLNKIVKMTAASIIKCQV